MATFTLLPDDTSSNDWNVTGSSAHEAVQADDGDTTNINSTTNGDVCVLTMANPSVSEGAIDSITNYRLCILGRCPSRGTSGSDVSISVIDPTNGATADTVNLHNAFSSNETECGSYQTSSISYSDLEGMTIRLQKSGTALATITYAYVIVTYEAAAVAVTDNPIFFGTNF